MLFMIKQNENENQIEMNKNYGFKLRRAIRYSTHKPMQKTSIRQKLLMGTQPLITFQEKRSAQIDVT